MTISAFNLYSQECKYRTNKVDDFTNEKLLETKWQTVSNRYGLLSSEAYHLSLVKVDDSEFVEIAYEAKDRKKRWFSIYKNESKLLFKLQNGTVLELECGENESYKSVKRDSKRQKSGDLEYKYFINGKYVLTPQIKEAMATSPIQKIRLILKNEEHFEVDIEPTLKAPLLGITHRGMKAKKSNPTNYFIDHMACID